ncbi:MAG: MarR family transcriptional regulator [Ignavibacteriales bacterium]|nr:MarR family transcriptional regulator [Ignavibacteriales bacterium]MCF8435790.1 MarR family transcriptional regulator [Ignavibacteriales bacterium]
MTKVFPKSTEVFEAISMLRNNYEKLKKIQLREFSRFNITYPQFMVLQTLSTKGEVSLKNLGDQLNVTGANITCIVDNLQKESYVQRISSNEDRRKIFAKLTKNGEKLIAKIKPIYQEKINTLLSTMGEEEFRELRILLEKLDKAFDQL